MTTETKSAEDNTPDPEFYESLVRGYKAVERNYEILVDRLQKEISELKASAATKEQSESPNDNPDQSQPSPSA